MLRAPDRLIGQFENYRLAPESDVYAQKLADPPAREHQSAFTQGFAGNFGVQTRAGLLTLSPPAPFLPK
jgi:hypothetical protein